MAVELPPPSAPQQVTVEQVQQQGAQTALNVPFQDYTLHVIGNKSKLGKDEIAEVIVGADSLSNAVRLINAAYYAAGYPGVKLSYALSGRELYILVDFGNVTSVKAPDVLDGYFDDLRGPLTDAKLEPRRALASIHADRADLVADMALKDGDGGNDSLVIKKRRKAKPDARGVKIEFGNPGNRYVGRHFIDVDLKGGIPSGDELRAFWRHGVTGINDADDAQDYNEQILGWNRVTPWGLFGVGGRYAYYNQTLASTPVDGVIYAGELYWMYVPAADFNGRWTVQAKVDRSSKETSTRSVTSPTPTCPGLTPATETCQRELYTSAEIGSYYSFAQYPTDWRLEWATDLSVRQGLTNGAGFAFGAAVEQDYTLIRPGLHFTAKPTGELPFGLDTWKFGADLTGQYSSNTLPEQQQFVLGGVGNLLGYLPGAGVGDSGALLRLRAEWQVFEIYDVSLTPRVFVEYGYASLNDNATVGDQSLADISGEVSLKFLNILEATVSAALPVTDNGVSDAQLDDSEADFFLKLSATF